MPEPATFDYFADELYHREQLLCMDHWCSLCIGEYREILCKFLADREGKQRRQKIYPRFYKWEKERLIAELRTVGRGYGLPSRRTHVHVSFGSYLEQLIRRTIHILWVEANNEGKGDECTRELKILLADTHAGKILDSMIEHYARELQYEEQGETNEHFDKLEAQQRRMTRLSKKGKQNWKR